jgi:hypothetical protein
MVAMLPGTVDWAMSMLLTWATKQLVQEVLVPGRVVVSSWMMKLEEFPIDCGLVRPEIVR